MEFMFEIAFNDVSVGFFSFTEDEWKYDELENGKWGVYTGKNVLLMTIYLQFFKELCGLCIKKAKHINPDVLFDMFKR